MECIAADLCQKTTLKGSEKKIHLESPGHESTEDMWKGWVHLEGRINHGASWETRGQLCQGRPSVFLEPI